MLTCNLYRKLPTWSMPKLALAILECKNWAGGTAGSRKKVGGQHKCLYFLVIFRCNEDLLWLPYPNQHRLENIVRTVARKSSSRLKFCWLKVIYCICQWNELEPEIKHNMQIY